MRQGDIFGDSRLPERKIKLSTSQRIIFGLVITLFFCLYPAIYVFANHLSAAQIVANARAKLGSPDYPGLCERLTSHVTDHASFPSAHLHMMDAINKSLCRSDWDNMKPGDIIFWCGGSPHYSGPYTCNPPFGFGWGHVGIYEGVLDRCGPWGRAGKFEPCYISGGVRVPGSSSTVERMPVWPTWNNAKPTCYQSSTDDGTVIHPPPPGGGTPGGSSGGSTCDPSSFVENAPLTGRFAYDPCRVQSTTSGLSCPAP
jgi:hypothetical protein